MKEAELKEENIDCIRTDQTNKDYNLLSFTIILPPLTTFDASK